MQQTNIKEEVGRLIRLQAIDTQLHDLLKEKEEKPIKLNELTKQFEEKKLILKDFEERSKALLLKRKDKEGELATKEETIKKLRAKQFTIKTNKEMDAMLSEIKGHEMDKSLLEETILKIFDAQDGLQKELEQKQAEIKVEENKFNQVKQAIDSRLKEIEGFIKDSQAKRGVAEKAIDPKVLAQYNRIIQAKDGLALVAIKDNACQGCHINVTHQTVNEIKMSDRISSCQMCARMLYIPEDHETN